MLVVIGGGPAGSSAARLLASWGHHVRVISKPHGEARLAVSIPPSTQKLFDAIHVTEAIDAARFIRSTGNTVWWGSEDVRVEPFANEARGWQAVTADVERVLLAEAQSAGAVIERRVADASDLAVDADSFVIDASGRSGVLARAKGLREFDEGPRTVALIGEWRRDDPWPVPDPSHTLIESYESGWAWSVPTFAKASAFARATADKSAGRPLSSPKPQASSRHVAVMVDPQRSGLARERPAREIYQAEIAKTRVFRSLVDGASLTGGPWGWDASTYRASQYAGDGWLLAGDAGWFVDPLSSAGVKKALASGWLAAIVANTWIARPERRSHALRFFSDRERELERHFSKVSRSFLAEAAPNHPHAFWQDRADAAEKPDEETPAIQTAFAHLRAAPGLKVRRSDALVIEPRPMIAGREIVLRPHIIPAGRPGGVRYLADVDLVSLVELAPSCTQVPDLFEAYQQNVGQVGLPGLLRALATAIARGWLVRE